MPIAAWQEAMREPRAARIVSRGRYDGAALRHTISRLQAFADQWGKKGLPRATITTFIVAALKAAGIPHYPDNQSKLRELMVRKWKGAPPRA
jgi:hypothetical protein